MTVSVAEMQQEQQQKQMNVSPQQINPQQMASVPQSVAVGDPNREENARKEAKERLQQFHALAKSMSPDCGDFNP